MALRGGSACLIEVSAISWELMPLECNVGLEKYLFVGDDTAGAVRVSSKW